jgi:repressor LexA
MLSKRQEQLCRTIETLTADRGFPPSVREIAAAMGVHASRAAQLVRTAEARGAVAREPRVARSLRVTQAASKRGRGR